ncbi:rRNA maturation RNase YbeY [Patulibacter minatonensis]|uniref:rRNA maturation RNase YbeY n=1 Tax=Patulibacter minatonensis TaxID=298163 RepID=UPI0004B5159B|nr:rRNA maturation RNase YbeY [Patulibacter minatonensis]
MSGPDPEAFGTPVPGASGSGGWPSTSDVGAADDLGPDVEGSALEIELEVDHEDFDEDRLPDGMPSGQDLRELVETAAASAGVTDGHVAITILEPEAIHALNLEHRGRDKPTDVLSFPVDGAGPVAGPREIGDVVVCPEHTVSMREAVVHGILHLVGFDHETDSGEMLAVQGQILSWYENHDPPPSPPAGPTAGTEA